MMLKISKCIRPCVLLALVGCLWAGCAQEQPKSTSATAEKDTKAPSFTLDEQEPAYVMIQIRKATDDGTVVDEPAMHGVAKAINYVLSSNQMQQKISSFRTEGTAGTETFMVLREFDNFADAREGALILASEIRNTEGVLLGQPFAIPRSQYVASVEAKNFDAYQDYYFTRFL